MAKVYVVTEGGYSDYHICAMFSERRLAELYIQTYAVGDNEDDDGLLSFRRLGQDATIEEWELDQDGEQLLKGYARWHVIMDRNGNLDSFDPVVRIDPPAQYDKTPFLQIWPNGLAMECYPLAMSAEHAVKIANEMRTRIIAENNWKAGYESMKPPMSAEDVLLLSIARECGTALVDALIDDMISETRTPPDPSAARVQEKCKE